MELADRFKHQRDRFRIGTGLCLLFLGLFAVYLLLSYHGSDSSWFKSQLPLQRARTGLAVSVPI